MAYIVVVNPSILSTPGTGMAFSGVLTATVLVCFVMTLFMGVYAKLPFAVAPGMGINAFFTFTIILTQKVWWQTALGIIFWAGVLFLVISITPIRETIAKAIPTADSSGDVRAGASFNRAVAAGTREVFVRLKSTRLKGREGWCTRWLHHPRLKVYQVGKGGLPPLRLRSTQPKRGQATLPDL